MAVSIFGHEVGFPIVKDKKQNITSRIGVVTANLQDFGAIIHFQIRIEREPLISCDCEFCNSRLSLIVKLLLKTFVQNLEF